MKEIPYGEVYTRDPKTFYFPKWRLIMSWLFPLRVAKVRTRGSMGEERLLIEHGVATGAIKKGDEWWVNVDLFRGVFGEPAGREKVPMRYFAAYDDPTYFPAIEYDWS
jgi:hypothetical protein